MPEAVDHNPRLDRAAVLLAGFARTKHPAAGSALIVLAALADYRARRPTGGPARDDDVFCADGCGRPATCERLDSLTSGGDEIVELVCTECARSNP